MESTTVATHFLALGGLLPRLAKMNNLIGVVLVPGTALDSLLQPAPIILMTMVYQNNAPSVTRFWTLINKVSHCIIIEILSLLMHILGVMLCSDWQGIGFY
jgi:hypothetical protein